MALAIDASSPAVVLNPTGNGVASVTTTTTAAFSPPAGSLLLLVASIDVATGNTPTLAVSGGTGLTWTQVLNQNAAAGSGGRSVIWTAPNTSAQSNIQITLTGTGTGSPYSLAMKLYVLTGADTTTPVATSLGATMSITGNATKQQSLTNGTRANGLLFSVYTDYQCATQTAPTSSDLTVDAAGTLGGTSLDINYGFGHRTATAASTAYTATWADNTTGGAAGSVAAVIIQPSAAATGADAAFRGQTTTDSGSAAATGIFVTLAAPAGVVSGDQLIAAIELREPTTSLTGWRVPTGWTAIQALTGQGTGSYAIYTAKYGTDVTGTSWTWDNGAGNTTGTRWAASLIALNGAQVGAYQTGAVGAVTGTTTTSPTVTTTSNAVLVGLTGSRTTGGISWTWPAGWVEEAEDATQTATNGTTIGGAIYNTVPAPAGSYSVSPTPSASVANGFVGLFAYTAAGAADTTAPTVPTNVAATANSATSVTVSWTASTDAVGVSSYRIMRGGTALTGAGAVTGTSFVDTTVSASTAYSYTVSAVDAAGNRSAESTAANVTTPAATDTTAPTVPTGVTATANSATSVTVSWTASTDAVGVASYRIRRGGSDLTGATAVSGTTFTDTTAAASTAYSYTVSAVDAAGNRSAESTAANVTTAAISSTLTDDFSTKDTTKWFWSGAAAIVSGQLNLPADSSYDADIQTNALYDLTNSSVFAQLISPCPAGNGTTETFLQLWLDSNHKLTFGVGDGNAIFAQYAINGATTAVASGTYNASIHKYLRISHNGTQVVWSYSADAVNWTTFGTWTPTFAVTAMRVLLISGYYGTEPTPGAATWDNINVAPATTNYSIYGTNSPGAVAKANDGTGLSVATAFYTNASNGNGIDVSTWQAIGARFYVPAGVTIASPQMNLWGGGKTPDLTATPLATALMGTLTAGQWNEVLFPTPVNLTPGTYYWIGYHTGSGSSDYLAMASPTTLGIFNATNTVAFADTAETGGQRTAYRYDNGAAGRNNSLFSADVLVAPASTGADTTAPTVPTNVTAVANSANSVTVSWTASTDAVGVASYQVKRGGTIIANAVTTGTSYQDTTAAASTTYTYTVNAVDAAGNRSADSTGAGVTTPAGSGPWVRKSIIKNAGSGSTTQTINFTAATAGNLLVAICGGSVTFTTPAGWTLPATGSAVNASGLYLFYKTATAGESSFTTTNNGSNYPVGAIVYEFAAGSTVAQVVSASGVHTGTANPALTGLTGTNNLFGVANEGNSTIQSSTCTWSGVTGLVADVDQFQAPVGGSGGYELSTTYIASSTLTSFAPVPAFSASGDTAGNSERLTFAISPNNPNNPTLVNGVARPVVNGGTVGLDISATPPSGQTITGHSWVITNGNGTLTNATTATPTYTAPASGSGIATVTDTVTASGGGSSTATVFVSYGPNIVAAENAISGDARSTWDLANGNFGGLATLQGFADGFSFDKTQTVNFKIAQSDGAGWTADVYRMGYYGGNGGRVIASGLTPTGTQLTNSQAQPAPADADATTTLLSADCSAWATTMTWTPPSWAPSGVYILKLNRTGGGISHVIFMLRDDSRVADLLVMTADHTWNAYNAFGGMGSNQYTGNSLYYGTSVSQANADRAKFVSYDRPFVNRGAADTSRTYGAVAYSTFFSSEYTMVRFLERNGYDVKYYAGIDAAGDAAGSKIIGKCTAAMMVGHNEYWSNNMRAGWEAAKAAGVNIFVCASNEVFWRTVASTTDASGRPRVVECYKTTIDGQGSTRPQWTGTWRDPNGAGKGGSNPEISLTGTIFAVNGPDLRALTVPFAYASSKLWRGTSVASLTSGQTFTSPPQILGFEWDTWGPAGVNTTGATYMGTVNAQANYASSSTYSPSQVLTDAGGAYATGTVEHRLAITPGVNGSVVFGTGTCQWSWGLDNANTYQGTGTDNTSIVIQQATVNMLTDMNVTPKTVMSGLTVPAKYTWYTGSANLTHLGAGNVTLYLGGNAVNAVYIGSTKVYP